MVRLTRNSAHDENTSFLKKGDTVLFDQSQTSYHFHRGNVSSYQEIDKMKDKNVRKEVKDDLTNQALLSDDVDELYGNHLIEKRENSYLENEFIAPQDTVSKYDKYSETGKLKKSETTEPKIFRGNYDEGKLERIKYSETENEPHYSGNRLENESIEQSRKLSKSGKSHTRTNNALRKRIHNKDSSRNLRSRQLIRGSRKSQNNAKPPKIPLNKFENSARAISEPLSSQQHFHESSNNLISPNEGYFQTHKKRSSTEHSEDENAVGYSSANADSPELLLNTNNNKENFKKKQNGILKFNDYGIERLDGQQGEHSDNEGISEKPLSAEDDINLYLDNFNMSPNSSRRIMNGYRSKSKSSQFSNNKIHLNPSIHIHPTNPVLNTNDNNLFQNSSFTLPPDVFITELNKNINLEDNRAEILPEDIMEHLENYTLSDSRKGYNNMSCVGNRANTKDVFDEHTTSIVSTAEISENNTFMEINNFSEINNSSEITASDFTDFTQWSPLPEFTESTESTTGVQEPEHQLMPAENESDTNEEDNSNDKLANEVIFKVLKKVQENENLRKHILPSLEINSEEIQNRKNSHKSTCKLNNKSVISKMSHELESLVEHEVREEECMVLSPQQKSSLTRLLEFSKKGENHIENNDEGQLKELVKTDSKDTDTSFAEAMTKKIATLKHLLSQYENLSEDEKLKVHNVHEYLIEQLNNVYRLINLEESHGFETHLSPDKEQNLNSDVNNSPLGDVKVQKINSADFGETSKQNKNNEINSISDESSTFDKSHDESSITDPLSNILDTLKKHITKTEFNKELQKNNESDKKQDKHLLKVRSTNDISDEINDHANLLVSVNKRPVKFRAKRKYEHQNNDLKSGGISSAYYTLALLAKEK